VEEAVKNRAHAAHLLGSKIVILQLAQDLRFPDHHGIEAGGDAEQMANG